MQGAALAGYRVLDLTQDVGWICGKLLADLGADVVKVEPPGGDPGRARGPFYQQDPNHSLPWWAYNTNKRSLCLDLDQPSDRDHLCQLVEHADVVIESFPPGYLNQRGLGYDTLKTHNPNLIVASITPFGQSGPYRDFKGPDIVCMALGGMMALTGEAPGTGHGQPVRISLPQAELHAGAEAAMAILLANHWRQHRGIGDHIDISMQASAVWTLMAAPGFVPCNGLTPQRNGPFYNWVGYPRRLNFPCRDGHVAIFIVGRQVGARSMQGLTAAMHAEGMAPSFMLEQDWAAWRLSALGLDGQAESDRIDAAVMAFTQTKTKQELYDLALKHRIFLAPVSTIGDLSANVQLRDRQFFVPVEHPELGITLEYPGPFARFHATPCRPPTPAPRVGEHTQEVMQEWLQPDSSRAPRSAPDAFSPSLPLKGLRVLDFTWVAAGPLTAKYLGDHGAEVIRVESWAYPDSSRYAPPHMLTPETLEEDDRSYFFSIFNTSKKSISLNLGEPEARDLIRRLVAEVDIVIESYTPQVMRKWELDYDHLVQIKPDLIMLSTCMQGQTGPHAHYPGFGNLISGLLGFYQLTGWPDGEPCAIYGAYTDFIVPHFAALSILAALDYRRRTGHGQYIDLAQSEASLQFLAPALLDYSANGHVMQRQGNRDPHMAPHGVYPCDGPDRWCAIAVDSDDAWQHLCDLANHPDWRHDVRFATLAGRLAHADELDALVSAWTETQCAETLMQRLQTGGIAAGVVRDLVGVRQDPQLHHRGFWVDLNHGPMGNLPIEGHQFRFASHPNRPRFARPKLGEHNAPIFQDLLRLSDRERTQLEADGVIY